MFLMRQMQELHRFIQRRFFLDKAVGVVIFARKRFKIFFQRLYIFDEMRGVDELVMQQEIGKIVSFGLIAVERGQFQLDQVPGIFLQFLVQL